VTKTKRRASSQPATPKQIAAREAFALRSRSRKAVTTMPFSSGDRIQVAPYNGNDTGKAGTVASADEATAIVQLQDGRRIRFNHTQLIKL
jgi:transcription elongation factor